MTPPSPDKGLREAVALAECLVRHALDHDHARGCDGRMYECACGYDERLMLFAAKLREALPALSVPEGWVAVPREPTVDMVRAGNAALSPWVAPALHSHEAYRAMLSAIPSPGGEGSSRPWPIDGAGNLGSAVASGDAGDATTPGGAE